MSNPGKPTLAIPDLPFLKNYPLLNTAIRGLLGIVGALAVGWLSSYVQDHHWNLGVLMNVLPELIASALVTIAAFIWTLVAKYKTIISFVEHVLEAANTGEVAPEVKAIASAKLVTKIEEAGK